jgi:uncharacterized membrane protein
MFETLFQALFTYRPVVFQQGEFRFDVSGASLVAAAVAAVVGGMAIFTYRHVRVADGNLRDTAILTALRLATLGVVLFCLFRPTLVVRAAVNQRNVVAVVLDDSRSMQIPDAGGKPRADYVREQFGDNTSPGLKPLADRFLVRTFRFSAAARRAQSGKDLTFEGTRTNIGAALDGVREELRGLPVAGVVVVSDGADTSETAIADALLGLKAEKLPVFTVGVGADTLPRDVQIDRVSTPRTVLKGAALLVDVTLTHSGLSGRTATVDVEDEGRIVGSERLQLPANGTPATVRVRAVATEAGPRLFTFKVAPVDGETVPQNNAREALINVRDEAERILYFEGEPRFEMKFLRRAVADDKNLLTVALQRTADNKYMRIDGDPDEVAGGFPKSREELFRYRGLILGSVEAGIFSGEQLQMIADFVDRRGGGLLMMGGARSFGEGGYGGTPVADVLPLVIDPRTRASDPAPLARLKAAPTAAGRRHAATQLAPTEAASAARWAELPQVTSINAPLPAKPAATTLLTGTDERGRTHNLLTAHQFGRGKVIAFTAQDSWQWQMHASVPLEDQTHEQFWRQLIRWMVDGVSDAVDVRMADRVDPGDPVQLEASVADKSYVGLNDATVVAHVARPNGQTLNVPLQWTGERDGQYRGSFVSAEPGTYEVSVDATRGAEPVGSSTSYIRAIAGEAEYFDPTMHPGPLRRIADETGGRFYRANDVSKLAEDIRYAGRGVTALEERELWNMPAILLTLMLLVSAEWGYRRLRGLA